MQPSRQYLNTLILGSLQIKKGMETAAAFFETRRVAAMKGATAEVRVRFI